MESLKLNIKSSRKIATGKLEFYWKIGCRRCQ